MQQLVRYSYRSRYRWPYSTVSKLVNNVKATGEHITGRSEVFLAQARVDECKNALKTWRRKLTAASREYDEIQQQLKGLYTRKTHIFQQQKRDLSVLQSIHTEEESLLLNEQNTAAVVETCKLGERESFEALSDAIQDSHQKERAQSEQMRYYTRIGSLLGAFFGFLGSNFFIKREIKQHNLEQSKRLLQIEEELAANATCNKLVMTTVENIQEQLVNVSQSVSSMSNKVSTFKNATTQVQEECLSKNVSPVLVTLEPHSPVQPKNTELIAVGGVLSYSLLMTILALL